MEQLGWFVMAAVWFWLLLLVLVGLRSAFFLFTMVWLAALHVIESRRAPLSEKGPAT